MGLWLFHCGALALGAAASGCSLKLKPFMIWVAVKELQLRDYPPIMENQMEKNMEDDMETEEKKGI